MPPLCRLRAAFPSAPSPPSPRDPIPRVGGGHLVPAAAAVVGPPLWLAPLLPLFVTAPGAPSIDMSPCPLRAEVTEDILPCPWPQRPHRLVPVDRVLAGYVLSPLAWRAPLPQLSHVDVSATIGRSTGSSRKMVHRAEGRVSPMTPCPYRDPVVHVGCSLLMSMMMMTTTMPMPALARSLPPALYAARVRAAGRAIVACTRQPLGGSTHSESEPLEQHATGAASVVARLWCNAPPAIPVARSCPPERSTGVSPPPCMSCHPVAIVICTLHLFYG